MKTVLHKIGTNDLQATQAQETLHRCFNTVIPGISEDQVKDYLKDTFYADARYAAGPDGRVLIFYGIFLKRPAGEPYHMRVITGLDRSLRRTGRFDSNLLVKMVAMAWVKISMKKFVINILACNPVIFKKIALSVWKFTPEVLKQDLDIVRHRSVAEIIRFAKEKYAVEGYPPMLVSTGGLVTDMSDDDKKALLNSRNLMIKVYFLYNPFGLEGGYAVDVKIGAYIENVVVTLLMLLFKKQHSYN